MGPSYARPLKVSAPNGERIYAKIFRSGNDIKIEIMSVQNAEVQIENDALDKKVKKFEKENRKLKAEVNKLKGKS